MYPILVQPRKIKIQPKYTLLYTIINGFVYPISINKTAGEILSLCDGNHTVDDIIDIMHQRYNEDYSIVQKNVYQFIENSYKMGTIEHNDEKRHVDITIIGNENRWTPDFIDIELTHGCMLRCKHCYLDADVKKASNMIDFEHLSKLINDIDELGVELVQITGGEPLLHPRIREIIELLLDRDMQFVIVTSGFYYNDEILSCIEKIAFKPGCRLQVSLDGLEKKHNALRGDENAFKRTLNFIKRLIEKNVSIDIVTTTSENEYDREEMIQLCKLVKECGVKRFRITTTLELGRAVDNCLSTSEVFSNSVLDLTLYLKREFEDEKFTILYSDENNKKKTCGTGCTFFRVDPNMRIYPCPLSNDELGDLKESNIVDYLKKDSKYSNIIAPCKEYCAGCEKEYLCEGCISQGLLNHLKVSQCLWYENSGICK